MHWEEKFGFKWTNTFVFESIPYDSNGMGIGLKNIISMIRSATLKKTMQDMAIMKPYTIQ